MSDEVLEAQLEFVSDETSIIILEGSAPSGLVVETLSDGVGRSAARGIDG
jgi:hypothetical protein